MEGDLVPHFPTRLKCMPDILRVASFKLAFFFHTEGLMSNTLDTTCTRLGRWRAGYLTVRCSLASLCALYILLCIASASRLQELSWFTRSSISDILSLYISSRRSWGILCGGTRAYVCTYVLLFGYCPSHCSLRLHLERKHFYFT